VLADYTFCYNLDVGAPDAIDNVKTKQQTIIRMLVDYKIDFALHVEMLGAVVKSTQQEFAAFARTRASAALVVEASDDWSLKGDAAVCLLDAPWLSQFFFSRIIAQNSLTY